MSSILREFVKRVGSLADFGGDREIWATGLGYFTEGWDAHEKSIAKQMEAIPQKTFYRTDRYDTDDEYVLHLWDDNGNSFDIRISK